MWTLLRSSIYNLLLGILRNSLTGAPTHKTWGSPHWYTLEVANHVREILLFSVLVQTPKDREAHKHALIPHSSTRWTSESRRIFLVRTLFWAEECPPVPVPLHSRKNQSALGSRLCTLTSPTQREQSAEGPHLTGQHSTLSYIPVLRLTAP